MRTKGIVRSGLVFFLMVTAVLAQAEPIRILGYNTFGLPRPLLIRPSRLSALARHLPALGADVAGFNETFTQYARVLSNMPEYPYVTWGTGKSKTRMSSGLLIVSRWPIVNSERLIFEHCSGSDCFAAKGVLMARVQTPSSGLIDVYVTHLNAGTSDRIRVSQTQEMIEFIRTNSGDPTHPGSWLRPVVILGDLNATPGEKVYSLLAQGAGFRDTYREFVDTLPSPSPVERNGFTFDYRRNSQVIFHSKPRRIDFIWASDGASARTITRESQLVLDEPVEGKFLSDHFGLMTEFELEPVY